RERLPLEDAELEVGAVETRGGREFEGVLQHLLARCVPQQLSELLERVGAAERRACEPSIRVAEHGQLAGSRDDRALRRLRSIPVISRRLRTIVVTARGVRKPTRSASQPRGKLKSMRHSAHSTSRQPREPTITRRRFDRYRVSQWTASDMAMKSR